MVALKRNLSISSGLMERFPDITHVLRFYKGTDARVSFALCKHTDNFVAIYLLRHYDHDLVIAHKETELDTLVSTICPYEPNDKMWHPSANEIDLSKYEDGNPHISKLWREAQPAAYKTTREENKEDENIPFWRRWWSF